MALNDWRNINFTAREVLATVVFIISASGAFYKFYYDMPNELAAVNKELTEVKKTVGEQGLRLRVLEDAETARKERERLQQLYPANYQQH